MVICSIDGPVDHLVLLDVRSNLLLWGVRLGERWLELRSEWKHAQKSTGLFGHVAVTEWPASESGNPAN